MSNNNDCFTCSQLNKKHKSSIICAGCEKRFCKEHHQEHRKLIEKEFEGLIQQHNVLRQNLYNENNDDNNKMSQLIKMIDNWEKETIAKIKATASINKARVSQLLNEEKGQVKNKFKLLAEELKTNQSSSDYIESDIQEWKKQIDECKRKLEKLRTSNNDFVDVEINSIDWENVINTHQTKAVRVKARYSTTSRFKLKDDEMQCKCSTCGKSFVVNVSMNVSASQCGDCYDGCFHGNCVLLLANGLTKLVKDVRKGDILATPGGLQATVTYVIKILRKNKKVSMVSFDNGLIITPWHPIRINGKWTFPHNIGNEILTECEEVYNFALDVGHIVIINGIECVTLGHNFKGDVIEHPYFGTDKVLDDLRALDVFNNGFIELLPNSTIRSSKTGLISGICRTDAVRSFQQQNNFNIILDDEHV